MLRIRINGVLGLALLFSAGACAPRSTPAPVTFGGAGSAASAPLFAQGGAGSVIVRPGDTLYAISRYHQTALQTLIAANDLAPPFVIKPGQILRLPAKTPPSSALPAPPQVLSSQITTRPLPAPNVPTQDSDPGRQTAPSGPHIVSSAVNIAPVADTQDAGEDQTSFYASEDEAPPSEPKPAPPRKPLEAKAGTTVKLTAVAPAAPASRYVRFLWPAKGPILSDFGPKQNGLHNDGINIAMPPNGPVVAAGDGVVSYAGNGLRGYGNLLLIRHEGGWVTAYAHNSELLVGKGDRVKRGQLIAKAGRSGGVAQDQLHFEIRQGARAVKPQTLLAGG